MIRQNDPVALDCL